MKLAVIEHSTRDGDFGQLNGILAKNLALAESLILKYVKQRYLPQYIDICWDQDGHAFDSEEESISVTTQTVYEGEELL